MSTERAEVAGDTVSATLREMSSSAADIAVTLRIAADIRDGDPNPEATAAVALLVRRAERLVIELRRQIRRFPAG